jgi:hypothetical protein
LDLLFFDLQQSRSELEKKLHMMGLGCTREDHQRAWTAINLGGTCGCFLQSDRKGADLQGTTPYVLLVATSSPISTTMQPI